jgi:membrane-associated protease RseP (regulator of RpoE activity)
MNTWDALTQRVQSPTGAFELRRLSPGSHELVVNTASGATGAQVVSLEAGEKKTGVRIQVVPGIRITGRVLEHGTNKPIPGALVQASGAGSARATADVNPDGTFTIENAPSGEAVRLGAVADQTKWVPESKMLEIAAGQTAIDAGTIRLLSGNYRDRISDPLERGQIGTSLTAEKGPAVLRSVGPDSPAAKQGLKKGDQVLSIDGQDTTDLGSGALGYLVTGKVGTTLKLLVRSSEGGEPREVTLTRESFRTPSPPRSN